MNRPHVWLSVLVCVGLAWSAPLAQAQAEQCGTATTVATDSPDDLLNDEAGVARPQPDGFCSATAGCSDGTSVSCSTTVGSCTSYDAFCPSERGHVTCGSRSIYCAARCASTCSGGTPACSSLSQCENLCGGPGYGICNNGCCYCL